MVMLCGFNPRGSSRGASRRRRRYDNDSSARLRSVACGPLAAAAAAAAASTNSNRCTWHSGVFLAIRCDITQANI